MKKILSLSLATLTIGTLGAWSSTPSTVEKVTPVVSETRAVSATTTTGASIPSSTQKIAAGNAIEMDTLVQQFGSTDLALAALMAENKVILDFYSATCGPCKQFSPIFEQVAKKHTDIIFVKINGSKFSPIAAKYGIKGVPAVKFIKNGAVVGAFTGSRAAAAFEAEITKAFK